MNIRRTSRLVAALAALVITTGCGSFWHVADTDGTLEDSVRTYAKLIRWGELERASLFVDEAMRPDFIALAPGLQRLHFTDFDLGPVNEMPGEVRVTVLYRFYDVTTLVERQVAVPCVWTELGKNQWIVRPDLSGFEAVVGKPSRNPSG